MNRRPWTCPLVLAVILPLATTAFAAETHTGLIVSVGAQEITISTPDGMMQKFAVAADATISLDDHPAKLADLKPQQRVTLLTQRSGEQLVAQTIKAFTNSP